MAHQKKTKTHFQRTSLLAALLLHLIAIKTFIFVFPLIKESDKPNFVFLGSILKNNDISNISFNKPPTQTKKASNEFAYHKAASTKSPYKRSPAKPQIEQSRTISEKPVIKTTFEIPEEIPMVIEPEGNKQKIDENYEKYVPLRYYLK